MELEQEEEQIAIRKEVSAETPKPAKQARSMRGVPISTENRAKLRSTSAGKEKTTKQIAAKSKVFILLIRGRVFANYKNIYRYL